RSLHDALPILPLRGPGPAGVRTPRLPPGRLVLLVHLLADPGALPLHPRGAAADLPGVEATTRRPRRRMGRPGGEPRTREEVQGPAGQGRARAPELGGS